MNDSWGNFGLAILSQTSLEVENVFVDRENLIPALFVKTNTSLGLLNLVLLHPFPPTGNYATTLRDRYLDALSHQIRDLSSPLLVCGDFNTTPWSNVFKQFLQTSALEMSDVTPNSWPAIPLIPIDHCLLRGLEFVKYERGPSLGSDHWPLLIEVSRKDRDIAGREK